MPRYLFLNEDQLFNLDSEMIGYESLLDYLTPKLLNQGLVPLNEAVITDTHEFDITYTLYNNPIGSIKWKYSGGYPQFSTTLLKILATNEVNDKFTLDADVIALTQTEELLRSCSELLDKFHPTDAPEDILTFRDELNKFFLQYENDLKDALVRKDGNLIIELKGKLEEYHEGYNKLLTQLRENTRKLKEQSKPSAPALNTKTLDDSVTPPPPYVEDSKKTKPATSSTRSGILYGGEVGATIGLGVGALMWAIPNFFLGYLLPFQPLLDALGAFSPAVTAALGAVVGGTIGGFIGVIMDGYSTYTNKERTEFFEEPHPTSKTTTTHTHLISKHQMSPSTLNVEAPPPAYNPKSTLSSATVEHEPVQQAQDSPTKSPPSP